MESSSGRTIILKSTFRVRTGLLEFIVVIFYAAVISYYPTMQQYIYRRILKEKQEEMSTINQTQQLYLLRENQSISHDCSNVSDGDVEAEAQAQSAKWLLYIGLVSAIPGIFSTLIIGSIIDARGRKLGMIIPSIGAIIKVVSAMLVIKLNWPIFVLLIGGFLDGCLGSFGSVLMAVFAYLADITHPGNSRTLRITIIEALIGIAASAASVGVGYFIKAAGYFYPMVAVLVLFVLSTILIIFCLPETIESRTDVHVTGCSRLTSTFKTYSKKREERKRPQLFLLITAFFLYEVALIGKGVIGSLYQMGFPFCWQSVKLGIYGGTTTTLQVSSMLILIRPLTKYFSVHIVTMFGLMSTFGELVITGLANTDLMLFIAPVAGFLLMMPASMIKSASSQLVGREEQGSLFAGISSIQVLCFTFGSSIFSSMYATTVETFPGFVFLLMAGIVIISLLLIGGAEVLRRKCRETVLYMPVASGEEDA